MRDSGKILRAKERDERTNKERERERGREREDKDKERVKERRGGKEVNKGSERCATIVTALSACHRP